MCVARAVGEPQQDRVLSPRVACRKETLVAALGPAVVSAAAGIVVGPELVQAAAGIAVDLLVAPVAAVVTVVPV